MVHGHQRCAEACENEWDPLEHWHLPFKGVPLKGPPKAKARHFKHQRRRVLVVVVRVVVRISELKHGLRQISPAGGVRSLTSGHGEKLNGWTDKKHARHQANLRVSQYL